MGTEHLILLHVSFLQLPPENLQVYFQAILDAICYLSSSPVVLSEYQLLHKLNIWARVNQIPWAQIVTSCEARWQKPILVWCSGNILTLPAGSLLFIFLLKHLYCFILSKCSFLFTHGVFICQSCQLHAALVIS